MLFSIIIPAYNASKHIENAINSVVKQPFFDYEIIIVNDGSKDNTLEIVNKLASKYMNIRVIAQSNSGASIARNNGIRHAKGDYIFFMDADDVIVENSLKKNQ
jgi:glycosyltransferase involved in cell wall biosynthesis